MKITIAAVVLGLVIIGGAVTLGGSKAYACGFFVPCPTPQSNELKTATQIQASLINSVPVPQLKSSSERANVAKRAQLFDDPNKVTYVYLLSFGKVMAFYTVNGKVSSLRSYMTPTERLVDSSGNPCTYDSSEHSCYVMESADIDGTYGDNVDGIFFFTTDGAYVEWKGEYMVSDQPLKLTTQPELVRAVK